MQNFLMVSNSKQIFRKKNDQIPRKRLGRRTDR